jgi:hypothetical protein
MRFRDKGSGVPRIAGSLPAEGRAEGAARAAGGPSLAHVPERMSSPTPRQQAGYLRRLLRRREIEVIDPSSGRSVPVLVELIADVIRLVPMFESPKAEMPVVDLPLDDEALRWAGVLARLRAVLPLASAEELAAAVEAEANATPPTDPSA